MNNLRKHGRSPFNAAVIHGGPGGAGEMYPVALEFSPDTGVLEPLQTADSVEGQVEELRNVLESCGDPPLTLIGFSWGAWLGYLFAASHPRLVKKLILVSSGVFEDRYAAKIMETRLSRLSEDEKAEALSLYSAVESNNLNNSGFARFGELMSQADSFDPLPRISGAPETAADADIYQKVWEQASKLRSSGQLLRLGEKIQCPVTAIHGDYDPGPAEGVREPLSRVLKDFRFILLPQCGHHPWLERRARDSFYRILREEMGVRAGGKS